VRVGSAKYVDYLQLVCSSGDAVGCSLLGAVLISFFDLFFVKFWFLQPPSLVMTDCKPALLGVLPEPMFFQCFLDLVVSSGWFLRSSKPCVAMAFADAPFICCLSSAFLSFGGRRTLEGRRRPECSSM
jgi:hypothetical protein